MSFLTRLFRWTLPRANVRPWVYPGIELTEVLSPEQFVVMYNHAPNTIKSVRIVPPQMGDADFGRIVVTHTAKAKASLVSPPRATSGRSHWPA